MTAAILKIEIIAYAQLGNPEEEWFKNISVPKKFDHTWLPDEVVLLSSSSVFCVVAPIKYKEAGDDSDRVRVPSAFEVLTGGVYILEFSVLRVPVTSKQIS